MMRAVPPILLLVVLGLVACGEGAPSSLPAPDAFVPVGELLGKAVESHR